MYLTQTGLLFTAQPFYNLPSPRTAYSISFGGAMCLVGHTCNGNTLLRSVGNYITSSSRFYE